MIFTSRIAILVRIVLLVITSFTMGYTVQLSNLLSISLGLLVAILFQVGSLAYQYNSILKRINFFFDSIRNDDFSLSFPINRKSDRLVQQLSKNLERVNGLFQRVQMESYGQEQYFRALIEHINVGILTFDDKGFVVHTNSSLKNLLGVKHFTHMRQLQRVDPDLAYSISTLQQHDQRVFGLKRTQGNINLLIKSSAFRNQGQMLTLLTIQDINQELDEKELDSWLKLIRVLTHEIMNSIAPVTALSEKLCSNYKRNNSPITVQEVDQNMIHTTIRGLEIIQEQGKGLIRFVETYRQLTRLPKPDIKTTSVQDMIDKTMLLYTDCCTTQNITLNKQVSTHELTIMADEKLVSQVLLNLMKNATEALCETENATIKLKADWLPNKRVSISVCDNGPGIPSELVDQVFIPFFTTRENGSGIGLSISRQIMRLHGGSLRVNSVPGTETVFTLIFNSPIN
jgi:two-component system, NtrC family, nitrogen regulation sensor histidine kinase NtrY